MNKLLSVYTKVCLSPNPLSHDSGVAGSPPEGPQDPSRRPIIWSHFQTLRGKENFGVSFFGHKEGETGLKAKSGLIPVSKKQTCHIWSLNICIAEAFLPNQTSSSQQPLAPCSLGSRTRIEAHFTCTSHWSRQTWDGKNMQKRRLHHKDWRSCVNFSWTKLWEFGGIFFDGAFCKCSPNYSYFVASIYPECLISCDAKGYQYWIDISHYFNDCANIALKHFARPVFQTVSGQCLAWIGQSLAGHQRGNRLSYTVWSPASAIRNKHCIPSNINTW